MSCAPHPWGSRMPCLGIRVLGSMVGRLESRGCVGAKRTGLWTLLSSVCSLLWSPLTPVHSLGLIATLASLLAATVLGLDAVGIQRRPRMFPGLVRKASCSEATKPAWLCHSEEVESLFPVIRGEQCCVVGQWLLRWPKAICAADSARGAGVRVRDRLLLL